MNSKNNHIMIITNF